MANICKTVNLYTRKIKGGKMLSFFLDYYPGSVGTYPNKNTALNKISVMAIIRNGISHIQIFFFLIFIICLQNKKIGMLKTKQGCQHPLCSARHHSK